MMSTTISKESKAILIDLNNLVHSILYEDIERHVVKNFYNQNLMETEAEVCIKAEISRLVQYLEANGYTIIRYYRKLYECEQEINRLLEQNKKLRHNISSLQKKINRKDKK